MVGIKGLRAQSDRMLSIGDGWTHVGILKVCPKKEKMLGVRSCWSWQMDRWMGRRWHTGQEMDGDRNNGALGPIRQNAVPTVVDKQTHQFFLALKYQLQTLLNAVE